MTDEELQEEQRRDFEACRDLAFSYLVQALDESGADVFDIEVEKNKKGEDVAWIYFRGRNTDESCPIPAAKEGPKPWGRRLQTMKS